MKRFFKPMFWFTVVFGVLKFFFALYGLFNSSFVASKIMQGVGAESAMNSVVLSRNLAKTAVPYLWGLLITSVLLVIAAFIMRAGKRWGFFLYAFTSAFLACFFFYASFNYFPVLLALSLLPLIGVLAYVTVLEQFWFNKKV